MQEYPYNVVVCGLVRNAQENLQKNLERLDALRPHFGSFKVVIYENDSTDRTKEILTRYSSEREDVFASMAGYAEYPLAAGPFSRHRIDLMSRYRNQYVDKLQEYPGTDYVVVIDLDVYSFSLKGFLNCFREPEGWDMKSAFGSNYVAYRFGRVFYDIYAYITRDKDLNRGLHFRNFTEFMREQRNLYLAFSGAKGLVPVNSNFNGLAIYRYACFTAGIKYASGPSCMEGVESYCEHVIFNKLLIEKGYGELFLDPELIVIYEKPDLWKHYRSYAAYQLMTFMQWTYGCLRKALPGLTSQA